METFQGELQKVMLRMPRWKREFQQRLRQVNDEVTALVVEDLVDDLLAKFKDLPDVVAYLQAVQASVAEHLKDFLDAGDEEPGGTGADGPRGEAGAGDAAGGGESFGAGGAGGPGGDPGDGAAGGDGSAGGAGGAGGAAIAGLLGRSTALRRYEVNVVVDSSGATGAPVIYESNPTVVNLVGRIEQMPMLGALVTDFTLIKPGVLHRANGGYLIIDALKLLSSPYSWDALKRALQFHQVRIESPAQTMGFAGMTLEPEPIPLDVKVILMGDRQLYYLLAQGDPDFNELFKVAADFDDDFVRDDETTEQVRAAHRRHGPPRGPAAVRPLGGVPRRRARRASRRGLRARHRPDARHRRPAAGGGPLGAARISEAGTREARIGEAATREARTGEAGERRARAAGHRRADLPLGPRAHAHARRHAARDHPRRHAGRRGRPGQRAVGAFAGHLRLRPAQPHHRQGPHGQGRGASTSSARSSWAVRSIPRACSSSRASCAAATRRSTPCRWGRASSSSSPTAGWTGTAPRPPSSTRCSRPSRERPSASRSR